MSFDPRNATIDESADLDYKYDWSGWLADGETIASHTLVATDGITAYNDSEADGAVTTWVKDAGPLGSYQRVTCHITTSAGRQDDRTIRFHVVAR